MNLLRGTKEPKDSQKLWYDPIYAKRDGSLLHTELAQLEFEMSEAQDSTIAAELLAAILSIKYIFIVGDTEVISAARSSERIIRRAISTHPYGKEFLVYYNIYASDVLDYGYIDVTKVGIAS